MMRFRTVDLCSLMIVAAICGTSYAHPRHGIWMAHPTARFSGTLSGQYTTYGLFSDFLIVGHSPGQSTEEPVTVLIGGLLIELLSILILVAVLVFFVRAMMFIIYRWIEIRDVDRLIRDGQDEGTM